MNIAVLSSPHSWHFRDLERAAQTRHRLQAISFSELHASVSASDCRAEASQTGLDSFDALLVRTMPPGTLEQVVFRMDVLGQLAAGSPVVLNAPRAIEAAVDKFLATAKLQAAGLVTPPTFVCQTAEDAQRGFEELGGDVVVKPLFGGEGRGIVRVSDQDLAWRTFQTLARLNSVLYLQKFIQHCGFDIRLFVIGDEVLGMRRSNLRDWRTNVSRGAQTTRHEVSDDEARLACAARRGIGAAIAGVDVLPDRDGRQYVLEVNAVPGWRALSRTLDVDVASKILDYLAGTVECGKER